MIGIYIICTLLIILIFFINIKSLIKDNANEKFKQDNKKIYLKKISGSILLFILLVILYYFIFVIVGYMLLNFIVSVSQMSGEGPLWAVIIIGTIIVAPVQAIVTTIKLTCRKSGIKEKLQVIIGISIFILLLCIICMPWILVFLIGYFLYVSAVIYIIIKKLSESLET